MSDETLQLACKKCRCIFLGTLSEPLCPRCIDDARRKNERVEKIRHQSDPPPNAIIECLIEREGTTTANFGRVVYTFKPDEFGRKVCAVTNPAHHKSLLKFPGLYCLYVPANRNPTVEKAVSRV